MSFLIDPPWLYATGRAYGKLMPQRGGTAKAVEKATIGAFLLTSVSLYLEARWTKPIWKACRAESGRDWMLNSGVFKFDWRKAGGRTHLVSALLFATYPLWLSLGLKRGRQGESQSR